MKKTGTKKHYNNNENLLEFTMKLSNSKWKHKNEKVINNIKMTLNAAFSFKFN